MRLPVTIATIFAILTITLAVGGWTILTGTSSIAAVKAQSSFEVKRPNSPSQATLQPLW